MSSQKTIFITGGNRGIGRGLVEAFLPDHQVIFSARSDNGDVPHGAQRVIMDVADEGSIQNAISGLDTHIDFLINNAGVLPDYGTPSLEADLEQISDAFNVNTLGPLRVCRAIVPIMNPGGRIINLSSGMGQLSDMNGGAIAYRVSKTALNAVTRVLAAELRHQDISVNSICPGWVQTDMGGPGATRTVEESVGEIVKFALSADFPTGAFLRDGRVIEW